jgi:ribosomal-protein-alanine N-acetyltransferase
MAFFSSVVRRDRGVVLIGRTVRLRVPRPDDYAAWAELRQSSEAFLRPFEPAWAEDELTRAGFRRRLQFYQRGIREGSAHSFFIVSRSDDQLLGGLTLSNIRHGVIGSCSLGYWIGERHARQGHMTDAVLAALPFVFYTLRLHRIEAACLADNAASIALLRRCGFSEEGLARKYLRINGAWRDHRLFSRLEEDR